jgi:hypothetical protein
MRGGPSIKHLDDVPAEEMLRYEFEDGRTASIWEKWIELSPRYFAFFGTSGIPGRFLRSTATTAITATSFWRETFVAVTSSHTQAPISCLSGATCSDPGKPVRKDANSTASSRVRDSRSAATPPHTKPSSWRGAPDLCRYRCQNACRPGYLPNSVSRSPLRSPTGVRRLERRVFVTSLETCSRRS